MDGRKSDWTAQERRVFARLSSPLKIQSFLDALRYSVKAETLSPRLVLRHRVAHCFDGALFAAAALEYNGERALVIDLLASSEDDHHVLAVYRRQGLWGAIGKSNYTGCRFRDPVYRTLRELVMSYFHVYFNLAGTRTLRMYSRPFDLGMVKDLDWRRSEDDVTAVGNYLDRRKHYALVPKSALRNLSRADERLFKAETLGLVRKGAFKI